MVKIGDTVRYLNAVGGGIVRRIEGKVAYVEEDGFETPVLTSEIVVVLPAGHEKKQGGPNLYFDQKSFDAGKNRADVKSPTPDKEIPAPGYVAPAPEKIVETNYGDRLNIAVAFEPTNIRSLDNSDYNAILVNDSNFFLFFNFMRRGAEDRGWHTVYAGDVAPNEVIDLAVVRRTDLNDYDKIGIQYVAFKKDKEFELKPPAAVTRRLDLTKFFKLHCFRPGIYFESPVMEIQLVKDDKALADSVGVVSDYVARASMAVPSNEKSTKQPGRGKELSPYKLLPLIEVDLHIDELVDTTAGMENKDMLGLQLDTVRKTMQENRLRKGQKIVFIHGKGDGVLRKAVRDLLKKEYAKCDIQDASFQEYGFGATLVTIKS